MEKVYKSKVAKWCLSDSTLLVHVIKITAENQMIFSRFSTRTRYIDMKTHENE